jgi:hypothetical protein
MADLHVDGDEWIVGCADPEATASQFQGPIRVS